MTQEDRIPFVSRAAILGIMTAVTVIFTYVIRIPIAPTRGYLNFGDVAIYFAAFTFGPWTAFIAGGLGTALTDIMAGYAQWAPLTFFAHGLQGLAAGMLFKMFFKQETDNKYSFWLGLFLSGISGTIIMVLLYFTFGAMMFGAGASAVEIPGNLLQNGAGIVLGILLWSAVRKAYPPVSRFRW
ncbi:MAG: ECF transporter S component [Spirochaetales bacterium]|nr:ECF transporter S component [Spirochaetales bacterium]